MFLIYIQITLTNQKTAEPSEALTIRSYTISSQGKRIAFYLTQETTNYCPPAERSMEEKGKTFPSFYQ